MVAICNKCGREFEVDKEEIEFDDDGFGFVYCPFCEEDCVEFMDKGRNIWEIILNF